MDDVMSGTGQDWGTRTWISALDLAVLQDMGLPVSNAPPTISDIPDQFIFTSGEVVVHFNANDRETSWTHLPVSYESSNPTLIPHGRLLLVSDGDERKLSIQPIGGEEGVATITVRLSDGILETSRTFNVRVSSDPFPWRNPHQRLDVNSDSEIAPNDALTVINRLNDGGVGPLAWREPRSAFAPYYDVHPDNILAPNDALEVINYVNEQFARAQAAIAAGGEGEMAEDRDTFFLMTIETFKADRIAKRKSDAIFSLGATVPLTRLHS
jgi:hypothetical protein